MGTRADWLPGDRPSLQRPGGPEFRREAAAESRDRPLSPSDPDYPEETDLYRIVQAILLRFCPTTSHFIVHYTSRDVRGGKRWVWLLPTDL